MFPSKLILVTLKYDSVDRMNNAYCTFNFLCRNFNTNIIIYELTSDHADPHSGQPSTAPLTPNIFEKIPEPSGVNIKLITEEGRYEDIDDPSDSLKPFHRTSYINRMIELVSTPIIANYDVDVILELDAIIKSVELITANEADIVYPYKLGFGQRQILERFRDSLLIPEDSWVADDAFYTRLKSHCQDYVPTRYGHAQFMNTESYRQAGGENENFFPGFPEDKERYYRFKKLGYKVKHLPDSYVYHLEHAKTNFSLQTFKPERVKVPNGLAEYLLLMKASPEELRQAMPPLPHKKEITEE